MCIGGMYQNFAGRDASRGMAKQSFDDGTPDFVLCNWTCMIYQTLCLDMLTPVDQPLDKLDNLTQAEMYVFLSLFSLLSLT